jgi:integral membrane protein
MTLATATRIIAYGEGLSFLVLLGIAMPLKYFFDLPMAVRFVGMAHGALFIAMLLILAALIQRRQLPVSLWVWGFVAALLPAGPFFYDQYLQRQLTAKAPPQK